MTDDMFNAYANSGITDDDVFYVSKDGEEVVSVAGAEREDAAKTMGGTFQKEFYRDAHGNEYFYDANSGQSEQDWLLEQKQQGNELTKAGANERASNYIYSHKLYRTADGDQVFVREDEEDDFQKTATERGWNPQEIVTKRWNGLDVTGSADALMTWKQEFSDGGVLSDDMMVALGATEEDIVRGKEYQAGLVKKIDDELKQKYGEIGFIENEATGRGLSTIGKKAENVGDALHMYGTELADAVSLDTYWELGEMAQQLGGEDGLQKIKDMGFGGWTRAALWGGLSVEEAVSMTDEQLYERLKDIKTKQLIWERIKEVRGLTTGAKIGSAAVDMAKMGVEYTAATLAAGALIAATGGLGAVGLGAAAAAGATVGGTVLAGGLYTAGHLADATAEQTADRMYFNPATGKMEKLADGREGLEALGYAAAGAAAEFAIERIGGKIAGKALGVVGKPIKKVVEKAIGKEMSAVLGLSPGVVQNWHGGGMFKQTMMKVGQAYHKMAHNAWGKTIQSGIRGCSPAGLLEEMTEEVIQAGIDGGFNIRGYVDAETGKIAGASWRAAGEGMLEVIKSAPEFAATLALYNVGAGVMSRGSNALIEAYGNKATMKNALKWSGKFTAEEVRNMTREQVRDNFKTLYMKGDAETAIRAEKKFRAEHSTADGAIAGLKKFGYDGLALTEKDGVHTLTYTANNGEVKTITGNDAIVDWAATQVNYLAYKHGEMALLAADQAYKVSKAIMFISRKSMDEVIRQLHETGTSRAFTHLGNSVELVDTMQQAMALQQLAEHNDYRNTPAGYFMAQQSRLMMDSIIEEGGVDAEAMTQFKKFMGGISLEAEEIDGVDVKPFFSAEEMRNGGKIIDGARVWEKDGVRLFKMDNDTWRVRAEDNTLQTFTRSFATEAEATEYVNVLAAKRAKAEGRFKMMKQQAEQMYDNLFGNKNGEARSMLVLKSPFENEAVRDRLIGDFTSKGFSHQRALKELTRINGFTMSDGTFIVFTDNAGSLTHLASTIRHEGFHAGVKNIYKLSTPEERNKFAERAARIVGKDGGIALRDGLGEEITLEEFNSLDEKTQETVLEETLAYLCETLESKPGVSDRITDAVSELFGSAFNWGGLSSRQKAREARMIICEAFASAHDPQKAAILRSFGFDKRTARRSSGIREKKDTGRKLLTFEQRIAGLLPAMALTTEVEDFVAKEVNVQAAVAEGGEGLKKQTAKNLRDTAKEKAFKENVENRKSDLEAAWKKTINGMTARVEQEKAYREKQQAEMQRVAEETAAAWDEHLNNERKFGAPKTVLTPDQEEDARILAGEIEDYERGKIGYEIDESESAFEPDPDMTEAALSYDAANVKQSTKRSPNARTPKKRFKSKHGARDARDDEQRNYELKTYEMIEEEDVNISRAVIYRQLADAEEAIEVLNEGIDGYVPRGKKAKQKERARLKKEQKRRDAESREAEGNVLGNALMGEYAARAASEAAPDVSSAVIETPWKQEMLGKILARKRFLETCAKTLEQMQQAYEITKSYWEKSKWDAADKAQAVKLIEAAKAESGWMGQKDSYSAKELKDIRKELRRKHSDVMKVPTRLDVTEKQWRVGVPTKEDIEKRIEKGKVLTKSDIKGAEAFKSTFTLGEEDLAEQRAKSGKFYEDKDFLSKFSPEDRAWWDELVELNGWQDLTPSTILKHYGKEIVEAHNEAVQASLDAEAESIAKADEAVSEARRKAEDDYESAKIEKELNAYHVELRKEVDALIEENRRRLGEQAKADDSTAPAEGEMAEATKAKEPEHEKKTPAEETPTVVDKAVEEKQEAFEDVVVEKVVEDSAPKVDAVVADADSFVENPLKFAKVRPLQEVAEALFVMDASEAEPLVDEALGKGYYAKTFKKARNKKMNPSLLIAVALSEKASSMEFEEAEQTPPAPMVDANVPEVLQENTEAANEHDAPKEKEDESAPITQHAAPEATATYYSEGDAPVDDLTPERVAHMFRTEGKLGVLDLLRNRNRILVRARVNAVADVLGIDRWDAGRDANYYFTAVQFFDAVKSLAESIEKANRGSSRTDHSKEMLAVAIDARNNARKEMNERIEDARAKFFSVDGDDVPAKNLGDLTEEETFLVLMEHYVGKERGAGHVIPDGKTLLELAQKSNLSNFAGEVEDLKSEWEEYFEAQGEPNFFMKKREEESADDEEEEVPDLKVDEGKKEQFFSVLKGVFKRSVEANDRAPIFSTDKLTAASRSETEDAAEEFVDDIEHGLEAAAKTGDEKARRALRTFLYVFKPARAYWEDLVYGGAAEGIPPLRLDGLTEWETFALLFDVNQEFKLRDPYGRILSDDKIGQIIEKAGVYPEVIESALGLLDKWYVWTYSADNENGTGLPFEAPDDTASDIRNGTFEQVEEPIAQRKHEEEADMSPLESLSTNADQLEGLFSREFSGLSGEPIDLSVFGGENRLANALKKYKKRKATGWGWVKDAGIAIGNLSAKETSELLSCLSYAKRIKKRAPIERLKELRDIAKGNLKEATANYDAAAAELKQRPNDTDASAIATRAKLIKDRTTEVFKQIDASYIRGLNAKAVREKDARDRAETAEILLDKLFASTILKGIAVEGKTAAFAAAKDLLLFNLEHMNQGESTEGDRSNMSPDGAKMLQDFIASLEEPGNEQLKFYWDTMSTKVLALSDKTKNRIGEAKRNVTEHAGYTKRKDSKGRMRYDVVRKTIGVIEVKELIEGFKAAARGRDLQKSAILNLFSGIEAAFDIAVGRSGRNSNFATTSEYYDSAQKEAGNNGLYYDRDDLQFVVEESEEALDSLYGKERPTDNYRYISPSLAERFDLADGGHRVEDLDFAKSLIDAYGGESQYWKNRSIRQHILHVTGWQKFFGDGTWRHWEEDENEKQFIRRFDDLLGLTETRDRLIDKFDWLRRSYEAALQESSSTEEAIVAGEIYTNASNDVVRKFASATVRAYKSYLKTHPNGLSLFDFVDEKTKRALPDLENIKVVVYKDLSPDSKYGAFDSSTNTITLNASKLDADTFAHEAAHAFDSLDPETAMSKREGTRNDLTTGIRKAVEAAPGQFPRLERWLKEHSKDNAFRTYSNTPYEIIARVAARVALSKAIKDRAGTLIEDATRIKPKGVVPHGSDYALNFFGPQTGGSLNYKIMADEGKPTNEGVDRTYRERISGRAAMLEAWGNNVYDKLINEQGALFRGFRKVVGDREVEDDLNVEAAAKNMHGKVRVKVDDIRNKYIKPLYDIIKENKLDVDRLNEYLYAKFAPERNAMIKARTAVVNPQTGELETIVDDGSGMSDAKAKQLMHRFDLDPKRDAYNRAMHLVWQMNAASSKMMLDYGFVTKEQIEQWAKLSPHYVPLKDIETKKFTMRRAAGRKTEAENPLAASIHQADAIIRAGEASNVNKVVARFVEKYDPDGKVMGGKVLNYSGDRKGVFKSAPMFVPNNSEAERELRDLGVALVETDESRELDGKFVAVDNKVPIPNELRVRIMRSKSPAPNAASFWENGTRRFVVFDKHNQEALNIADALNHAKLQSPDKDSAFAGLWDLSQRLVRFKADVSTTLNPRFILRNAWADFFNTSLILATEGKWKQLGGFAKHYMGAIKAVRDLAKGKDISNTKLGKYYLEAREQGMLTGVYGEGTFKDAAHKLERDVKRLKGGNVRAAWEGFKEFMETVGSYPEQGARLAVYAAMRDNGMSPAKAAQYGREVTVDFNAKGQVTPWVNSLYMFSNAGAQGIYRAIKAVKTGAEARGGGAQGYTRALLPGISAAMIMGFVSAMLMDMMGGDDDDEGIGSARDRLPKHVKDSAIAVPLGDGKYLQLPTRGMWQPFTRLGGLVYDFGKGTASGSEVALGFTDAIRDSVDFIGGSAPTGWQWVMPTAIDPFIQVLEGKDWTGKDLYLQDFGQKQAQSHRGKSGTGNLYKMVAQGLNAITGGDKVQGGLIDVHPETLQLFSEFFLGSLMTMGDDAWQTVEAIAGSEDGYDVKHAPFVGGVLREVGGIEQQYYGAYKEFNDISKTYDAYLKQAKSSHNIGERQALKHEADKMLKQHPWLRSAKGLRKMSKSIQELNSKIQNASSKEQRDALKKAVKDKERYFVKTVSKR